MFRPDDPEATFRRDSGRPVAEAGGAWPPVSSALGEHGYRTRELAPALDELTQTMASFDAARDPDDLIGAG